MTQLSGIETAGVENGGGAAGARFAQQTSQ